VLQPVVVRPLPDGKYELIAGERRWRAAQKAGVHQIPAVVRDVPDERLLELALIENVQREALNAIEEAQAYRILVDDLGMTQNEVAERVGKQRASVANAIRLLLLPPKVQEMVRSGVLSMGHARALLALDDARAILELAQRAVAQSLSVREVEAQAKPQATVAGVAVTRPTRKVDPNVAAAEQDLQKAIGSKVRIMGTATSGRVEIHYHGAEQLDRIYKLILDAAKQRV
jgi:ParB family chromosome partitioning protein